MYRVLRAVCAMVAVGAVSAWADLISLGGVFENDNDVAYIEFTVAQAGDVVIFSSSFVAGGFDPYLEIWDATTGEYIVGQDDGAQTVDLVSGYAADFYYSNSSSNSSELSEGTYIATITQSGHQGDGDNLFTAFSDLSDENQADGFTFTLVSDDALFIRTGEWTVNFNGVASASPTNVPEPGILSMLLIGLSGLMVPMFRRKSKT